MHTFKGHEYLAPISTKVAWVLELFGVLEWLEYLTHINTDVLSSTGYLSFPKILPCKINEGIMHAPILHLPISKFVSTLTVSSFPK